MAKANVEEIFEVPVEKVYKVLTDYESYPEFLDGSDDVEVLEMDENGGKVQFSINVIKKFTYVLEMSHEENKSVSWSFDSGDLFKTNEGRWDLEDLGDGTTKVNYEIDMAFKMMVPKMILKKLVGSNLPAMMEQYHEQAKSI